MLHMTPAGNPAYIDGEGPTIVLIHGVMMDHRMWEEQVKNLSRSFRVVRMNMLGHGKAPDPPGPRKLDDFVEQAREVILDVCGDEHPVIAGFSMGGLVVQAYAIKYSHELRGLLIMNAVYNRTPAEKESVMVRLLSGHPANHGMRERSMTGRAGHPLACGETPAHPATRFAKGAA